MTEVLTDVRRANPVGASSRSTTARRAAASRSRTPRARSRRRSTPILRPNTRKGFNRLLAEIRAHAPARVVVGLPLSLSGGDSAQTTEAREFAARLGAVLAVPVELYDERFTTALAQQRPGTAAEDSRAAAVLLEEWLAARR